MTTDLPPRRQAKLVVDAADSSLDATATLLGALKKQEKHTRDLYKKARKQNIDLYLNGLPLYALKEVGASGVRTSILEQAGVHTIGDVLSRGPRRLQHIRGIGPHSAQTAHEAAERIQRIAEKKLSVRLHDDLRPKAETKLLDALMHVRDVHVTLAGIEREAVEVDRELTALVRTARPATRWWQRPFLSKSRRADVASALVAAASYVAAMQENGLAAALAAAARKVETDKPHEPETMWSRYHEEPETFDTLLRSVIGFVPDDAENLPLGAPPQRGPGPRDGITTVYRMFDHQDTLLYVGISNRVDVRIEQHRASKEWFWRVDRITTINYPDRQTALDVEKHAIQTEKPLYNIIHNR
jgi:predicted GIY-YIG superfamily endonuclease